MFFYLGKRLILTSAISNYLYLWPRCGVATAVFFSVLLSARVGFSLEHIHSASPAYHAAIITSKSESTYNFHSPAVSYGVAVGRTLGFRGRLTAFFPVHLFQDGRYFHARDFYSASLGGELLLGAAYIFRLPDDQLVIADIGPCLNAVKLSSDTYEGFYSFTFGVAAGFEYLYPLNRLLVLGTFVSAAGHYLDFVHETNKLKHAVFVSAGITLGLRVKTQKKRTAP